MSKTNVFFHGRRNYDVKYINPNLKPNVAENKIIKYRVLKISTQ